MSLPLPGPQLSAVGAGAPALVVRRLGPGDAATAAALNALFADAFEDDAHYLGAPPSGEWIEARLSDPSMLVLVAERAGRIVGGLTAYVLPKLEQSRPEFFLYDIAVETAARRQGVASALLAHAGSLAAGMGALSFFVLAHAEDREAVAFYRQCAEGEAVLSFDLPLGPSGA